MLLLANLVSISVSTFLVFGPLVVAANFATGGVNWFKSIVFVSGVSLGALGFGHPTVAMMFVLLSNVTFRFSPYLKLRFALHFYSIMNTWHNARLFLPFCLRCRLFCRR